MQQKTALMVVYKFILFSFVGIFFYFNQLSCSRIVKEKENKEIIIRIEDASNKSIPFTIITVDEIEKSVVGQYFWEYHRILEIQTDETGSVKINVDGTSRYRVKVFYQNQARWFCSKEFESSEINYVDGIYVIKCSVTLPHEQNNEPLPQPWVASGGISSTIAGGNFWASVRQGLITSGLNHISTYTYKRNVEYEQANDKEKSKVSSESQGDVLNWFDKSEDPILYTLAEEAIPEDGKVKVYSHASTGSVNTITDVDELSSVLYKQSPAWKSFIDSKGKIKLTVELYACSTAGSENAIAYQFSAKYPSLTIKAATNNFIGVKHTNWFGNVSYRWYIEGGGRMIYIKNGNKIK